MLIRLMLLFLDVAILVSAACCIAAATWYMLVALLLLLELKVPADGIIWFLLAVHVSFLLVILEIVSADYVPAGHVLISADRYRIC
ncbi:hypothetical protein Tco_1253992 [Tanacetum coccineum]